MESLFVVQYCWLIPLLPLLGAAASGFFGARWLKGQSHWPIWITVGASAVLSFMLLVGMWRHMPHESYELPKADQAATPLSAEQWKAITLSASRPLFTWIEAGGFRVAAGFFIDPLTAVMLCVVTGIGFLICVYAKGYMAGDRGYFRFFAYLGLFIFMMTMLVMGENFLMLYLGWEGVGLCSYLLIGHYYQKPSAREAAKKAFLVNRVGDFGFGLGIMLIFVTFGTISYFGDGVGTATGVLERVGVGVNPAYLAWIPFLLLLGACGKSAQFPLHVWLPDAMEGPTPVSALIHAATMVTAGVYMIVRCGTLFVGNAAAMWTVAAIGTFTALLAATIALRQFDLKKVFAYSTISQLGFMFAAAGVFAPVAAIFHLVTHAFFKALLFLSSGVVMHAMLGHLDMRKMSGLKRLLPWTNWLMLIGCATLAGLPLLSGFFSKDEIIIAAWQRSALVGMLLLFTAFLTAYYTFRLYFRVFQGPQAVPDAPAEDHHGPHDGHDEHDGHEHEAHARPHRHERVIMILPLVVLALGAVLAGYLDWPHYDGRRLSLGHFLQRSPSVLGAYHMASSTDLTIAPPQFGLPEHDDPRIQEQMHALHWTMMAASMFVAGLGIYLAYLLHLKYRERGEALAGRYPRLVRVLEAKYWLDEIYQNGIVEPLRACGRAFFWLDRVLIDGLVTATGFVPQLAGFTLKLTTQRGSLQGYALLMVLGIVVILLILFI